MHEAILEAGEIMFIPNSAHHGVQNLDNTIGVSANLLSPHDQIQRLWFDHACESPDFDEWDEPTCQAFRYRYAYRANHTGPQREVTYEEYVDDDFFKQSFDSFPGQVTEL